MNTRWPGAMLLLAVTLAVAVAACSSVSDAPAASFVGNDGAALYAQACAACHGADLRGTDHGPPFLDAIYRPAHHGDGAFLLAIRGGSRAHHWRFGNMPPIPGLTDEQAAAITRFVREQQRAAGID